MDSSNTRFIVIQPTLTYVHTLDLLPKSTKSHLTYLDRRKKNLTPSHGNGETLTKKLLFFLR